MCLFVGPTDPSIKKWRSALAFWVSAVEEWRDDNCITIATQIG